MNPTDKSNSFSFLARGGEMGELIRLYDWSTTPLDTLDQWPSSLRTLISMMLTSRFPMLIFWGPELITFYNDAFRPSLGNNGKHPSSLGQRGEQSWAESWPVIGPMIYNIMAGGEAVWFEDQKLPLYRDGQMGYAYWTYSFSPLTDDSGEVNGVLVTCSETTKAVEGIQKLEESEARFRSLIEESPVGTCMYAGPEMRIEIANRIILDYWGKGDGVLGKPMLEVMPEMIGQPFPKLLEQVYKTGKMVEQKAARAELRVNGVLGVYYFDFSYKPLFDSTGKVYAILDTAFDVTKQVLAHQKLEEAEISLRGAIELAELGTWSIDVATNGLIYSDRMIEWFGYDPAEHPYHEVIPILQGNDQERVSSAVAWALNPESDGIYDEEYTIIHPETGKKRILRAQGKVVYDETGKAIRMNGTAQDITMQRELQLALESEVQLRTEELAATNEELAATNEELAASIEELEASNEEYAVVNTDLEEANSLLTRSNNNLQQFAYVASHDLQEPLRKIQQFGDILKSQYAESLGTGIDYLNRMQLAASRMSTLIQDLLAYSRIASQREVNALVNLTEVIADVLNDLDLLIQETGAEITVSPLVTLIGDAPQLRLLIQNLLTNALKFRRRDTIPVITITGQLITAEQLPITAKPARWAQSYYCFEVSDNGIGFEEKYLDRIFQVFQRLHGKNEFAGTGIGLAICEKVVTNHGGIITARSQPGQGATFSVYLPM